MKIYSIWKKFLKRLTAASIAIFMLLTGIPIYSATEISLPELQSEVQTGKVNNKILAFDGAEGGGMWTTGARGAEKPEIYHVTNLNDSGSGSFRDAVSKDNRFIVFDVGGNIKLKNPIYAQNVNNLTILGQTAPGDGISIEGEQVQFSKSRNIIMRYLRIRMASKTREQSTIVFRDCDDIIIDHCSFSWSVDECADIYAVKNATIQWCIVSEALNNSVHSEGAHSMGSLWSGINMTAHHNLMASNYTRNPMIPTGASTRTYYNAPDTDSVVNIRNNVIYNWGGEGYGAQNGIRVNFIGNYYRPGPGTKESAKKLMFNMMGTQDSSPSLPENGGTTGGGKGIRGWGPSMYLEDNYIENADEVNEDNWKGIKIDSTIGSWEGSYIKCDDISDGIYVDGVLRRNNEYLDEYPIITQKPQSAYNEILKYVGASDRRDSIDERVINDVINRTAPTGSISGLGFIDSPDDVGGFIILNNGNKPLDTDNDGLPDDWEDKNGLDKNDPTDSVKINSNGYTMIEAYGEELITGENKPADKSELKQNIYSAFKLNKYDYTIKSWDNMRAVLNDAKETVSIIYPSQSDIDAACENLKSAVNSLEIENKYDLRIEIENAKKLDSQAYFEESFDVLKNAVTYAEQVYNGDFSQEDIDKAIKALKEAVEKLEFNYRYMLEQLIKKAEKEDQVSYTIQSITNLIEKNNAAKDLIKNPDASNEELKAKYDDLKSAHDSLEKESDVYSRFTGDFENLLCYKVNNGYYGKFFLRAGEALCEVRQGVGNNNSKVLVINDNITNSTSLIHRLSKKLVGNVRFEADYYFEDEPKALNTLLKLSDSDLTDNGAGIFLNLKTKKNKPNICLEVDNSSSATMLSNVIFEQKKWYNIRVDVDSSKRDYVIYINDKEVQRGHITAAAADKDDFGVISYQIVTPGKESQILALDNLKVFVLGDKEKLKYLIDTAKTLDGAMYTEESFKAVQDSLAAAEKLYNSPLFVQGDDIQIAMDSIQNSIDCLERSGLGSKLSELINMSIEINQMEYTAESVENLSKAIQSAQKILNNMNSSSDEIESEYTKLNTAFSSLVRETEVDVSKLSGDFEKLSCIGLGGKQGDSRYGRYRLKFLDNICRIKENIGGNPTKSLWMSNISTANRALFEYNFTERYYDKINGIISIEGDYYFEVLPTTSTILLRLFDNNFGVKQPKDFLTITPVNIGSDMCLRVNYMGKEINDFSNVVFKTGKWYNIKTVFDTINKEYSVYVDGNEIITAPLTELPEDGELGLSRYYIATAGKNIIAIDNLKSEFAGDMDNLKSYVDEAKKLNPKIYTEESYSKLKNILESAENVCNGSRSLQAGELRDLCETFTVALEEVKNSVKDSGCKLLNCQFSGDWVSNGEIIVNTDIVNYGSESENVILITASYENGKLVDSDLKEITIERLNSEDNVISSVNLGNDIENCNVKVFLWRKNSLEPLDTYYGV